MGGPLASEVAGPAPHLLPQHEELEPQPHAGPLAARPVSRGTVHAPPHTLSRSGP